MNLFLFLAASYGAALALTVLYVGEPYRWLGSKLGQPGKILTACPACTSFWFAIVLSCIWWSPAGAESLKGAEGILAHAIDGFASCGVTWMVHVSMVKLGQNNL